MAGIKIKPSIGLNVGLDLRSETPEYKRKKELDLKRAEADAERTSTENEISKLKLKMLQDPNSPDKKEDATRLQLLEQQLAGATVEADVSKRTAENRVSEAGAKAGLSMSQEKVQKETEAAQITSAQNVAQAGTLALTRSQIEAQREDDKRALDDFTKILNSPKAKPAAVLAAAKKAFPNSEFGDAVGIEPLVDPKTKEEKFGFAELVSPDGKRAPISLVEFQQDSMMKRATLAEREAQAAGQDQKVTAQKAAFILQRFIPLRANITANIAKLNEELTATQANSRGFVRKQILEHQKQLRDVDSTIAGARDFIQSSFDYAPDEETKAVLKEAQSVEAPVEQPASAAGGGTSIQPESTAPVTTVPKAGGQATPQAVAPKPKNPVQSAHEQVLKIGQYLNDHPELTPEDRKYLRDQQKAYEGNAKSMTNSMTALRSNEA